MIKTAVLVDGGFYLKRIQTINGKLKNPKEEAKDLHTYCFRHLKSDKIGEECQLYRIFYYDCPPSEKKVYHPKLEQTIDLKKTDLYKWKKEFFYELAQLRKVALRMGELQESFANYIIKPDIVKKICNGKIMREDLKEEHFTLDIRQKGVDMKIGLDIATLSHKKQVDQIVLIAGDSDFVPAAKHARREGIDFILDPLWQTIKPSLNEHIDGLKTRMNRP